MSAGALDLLPSPKRLKVAMELALTSHTSSSAAKALAAAQDYLEMTEDHPLDAANAHLLRAIALRRMGRPEQATAAVAQCITILTNTGLRQRRAQKIRVDLFLEQAITAFLKDDFIDSARHNERAAQLAGESKLYEQAARGFLNAAISWDRQNEQFETRRCLAECEKYLQRVNRDPNVQFTLQGSFLLFRWRLGIDHGPLVQPPDFSEMRTRSQQTLYFLYLWEQTLLTGSPSEAQSVQNEFLQMVRDHQETQFQREFQGLSAGSRFFIEGKSSRHSPILSQVSRALDGQTKIAVLAVDVAAWLCQLMSEGRWKSLEKLACQSSQARHPCLKAWGDRALFWLKVKDRQLDEGKTFAQRSMQLAELNGMKYFGKTLLCELQACEGGGLGAMALSSPQEKRICNRLIQLLPHLQQKFLQITLMGNIEVEINQADLELKNFLASALGREWLAVDAIREQIHMSGRVIFLDKMPIQKKVLFALLSSYPKPLSKEELVNRVWEESYNPLVHDTTLYRTISRLRRCLIGSGKPWIILQNGHLKLVPDQREFLAILPKLEIERKALRLHERQVQILSLLKYRGRLTRAETVQALKVPARTAARDLGYLVEKKMIVRTGQGRTTCYYPAL